jgi:hypothetical protein
MPVSFNTREARDAIAECAGPESLSSESCKGNARAIFNDRGIDIHALRELSATAAAAFLAVYKAYASPLWKALDNGSRTNWAAASSGLHPQRMAMQQKV